MKILSYKFIITVVVFALCLILCKTVIFADTAAETYDFDKTVSVKLGETYQIELGNILTNLTDKEISEFYYTSSDESVAGVSQTGLVTTSRTGQTSIIITNDELKGRVTIYVLFKNSGYEPSYFPSAWSAYGLENRSSYAYALDILSTDSNLSDANGNYFFLPGEIANLLTYNNISDREADFRNIPQVINCVIDDICSMRPNYSRSNALIELGINEKPSGYKHKVVLFVSSNTAATVSLWYRQNANGTWSYKSGTGPVTNLDLDGKIICNPITCAKDVGSFKFEYVGCYSINSLD